MGDESVSILLDVLQVGPNGESDVTRSEPVRERDSMSEMLYNLSFDKMNSLRVNVERYGEIGSCGKGNVVLQCRSVPDL